MTFFEISKEHKPHLLMSPFICCVESIQHPASFSVVSEGEIIHAGQTSIDALKTLYASFHMLRIPYPSIFSTFFKFLTITFSVCIRRICPSVADLHVLLNPNVHPSS
jgi:hypothetical protein